MAYGIEGLGKATAVVEIPMAMFEPSGDRVSTGFITPSINDFIEAASDSDKIKYLSGNTQLKISKASLGSGFDANNVPIPLALPRRSGIIPPLLMPAFRTGCSVDIMSACLTIIKDFGNENLNEEGRLKFWIACYPTLQLLWILSMEPNSDEKLNLHTITTDCFPALSINEWAMKKKAVPSKAST